MTNVVIASEKEETWPLMPSGLKLPQLRKKQLRVAEVIVSFCNTNKYSDYTQLVEQLYSYFKLGQVSELGHGCYRSVYALPYHLVLKIDRNRTHSNRTEHEIYHKFPKLVPKIFVYMELAGFHLLVAERAVPLAVPLAEDDSYSETLRDRKVAHKHSLFINKYNFEDDGVRNIGLLRGRIVMLDCGNGGVGVAYNSSRWIPDCDCLTNMH